MFSSIEDDDTNAPDKEERKRIRAARVLQTLEGEDADADAEAGDEGNGEGRTGQKQIVESMAKLDKQKLLGLERVTQVRVDADEAENERRMDEEHLRRDRLGRMQEEAIESGKLNGSIELRWGELLDINMPQELNDEIELQKHQCDDIIASKDKLIRSFQVQLKDKDEQYVKALKRQAEDIDLLLKAMREEYTALRDEYEQELQDIDEAFLEERDAVMAKNSAALESLFEKRREMELKYLETKQTWEEKAKEEIEALQVRDAEEYSKTKIKLETEIQTLEQQLEEMRATYQLNTEKLEYNYRVLTERDAENTATLSRLKKQMMRLKDKLHGLVSKCQEMESSERRKNDELTEEYNRITKQYKDLQAKFRHFEMLDNRRYEELFNMHLEEGQDLVRKVLEADRIIHEQFLGYKWKGPVLEHLFNPATIAATNEPEHTQRQVESEDGEKVEGDAASSQVKPKVNGKKLRKVLEMLAQEAGFLVDKDVRQAIESMPAADAEISQAEALMRSLGVTDEAALMNLIPYFFEKKHFFDVFNNEEDLDNEIPLELQEVPISEDSVIKAVRKYIDDRNGQNDDPDAMANTMGEGTFEEDKNIAARNAVAARVKAQNDKRAREAAFWQRLSDVISDPALGAWKALENQMQRYNKMLKERADAIEDVDRLAEQNDQLRKLLSQYLGAPVNDELIVPPAQTIRLENSSVEETEALLSDGRPRLT